MYSLVWTTLTLISLAHAAKSSSSNNPSSSTPQIDYTALGTVALLGQFDGLSFYNNSAVTLSSSSNNTKSSTLVSQNGDGEIIILGSTDYGGSLLSLCLLEDGSIITSGNFTSLGGQAVRNIARYFPGNDTFSSLPGLSLSGQVNTLDCSTSTLFLGGELAPAGAPSNNLLAYSLASRSLIQLANLALLDAPVLALASTPSSLYVGGTFAHSFTSSSNGSSNSTRSPTLIPSLGSSLSPLSLAGAALVGSPANSNPIYAAFSAAKNILCPVGADGSSESTWFLQDGTLGSLIIRDFKTLRTGGIRLGNTGIGGRGVSNFR